MKNALFFGDSLTAGYGLRNVAEESFPGHIQQKINASNLNYKVVNAGLNGDTSAGGLRRIDYWLSSPVSVFVLELGVNDIIRGIPPQDTFKNLQAITDKVSAKFPDAKFALMGMRIPSFITSALSVQFNAIYTRLASVNQMALVPFFLDGVAGKADLNLPDRLHPSPAGYRIIADNVWPVLKKLFIDD